ncbi:MAG: iron ABC transporter permease [Anaerolineales bacterium]|nr:iron ABC transporter permease [Anaerolineales bacterium]
MKERRSSEPGTKKAGHFPLQAFPWIMACLGLMLMLGLNAGIGPVHIPIKALVNLAAARLAGVAPDPSYPASFAAILFAIRLPNAILIALTGMALSASGAAYQGVFRNPLADPYIIGVASGAGLGAVAAMSLRWPADMLGLHLVPLAAFAGAVLTVSLVYALARVGRTTPITTLILAGVAVSAFASALTSLMMLMSTQQLHRAIAWLMGGFALGGWEPIQTELPYLFIGITALILMSRPLNVLQFGDQQALQLGLNVERYKAVILIAASLTAATAVSFAGIIGFIGLIVPHTVRLLWGADYRRLIPLSTLLGGVVLLGADILARTVLSPQVLPVGIITAIFGAPFFLFLLRKTKQERMW